MFRDFSGDAPDKVGCRIADATQRIVVRRAYQTEMSRTFSHVQLKARA